jgi:hypothetical protein
VLEDEEEEVDNAKRPDLCALCARCLDGHRRTRGLRAGPGTAHERQDGSCRPVLGRPHATCL